jgi:hypothetical protein
MKDILYPKFAWIGDLEKDADLIDVVRRVIAIVDDDEDNPIYSVTQSSLWAVAMAYLDYKNGTRVLDTRERAYTATRGGVLGMSPDGSCSISLRSFLEERDPGFGKFSG